RRRGWIWLVAVLIVAGAGAAWYAAGSNSSDTDIAHDDAIAAELDRVVGYVEVTGDSYATWAKLGSDTQYAGAEDAAGRAVSLYAQVAEDPSLNNDAGRTVGHALDQLRADVEQKLDATAVAGDVAAALRDLEALKQAL
ncbi:MAG TPA: hypothetical protein VFK80_02655, partial [Limnochordia bacterium]|nr:hypothetical protein [Limnochordia bacterium]